MRPLTELFDLSGRVAIVTGGSRGLGEEMAEGLAEAGASLMLCARREQWLTPTLEGFRSRGFTVEGLVCDVTMPEQVQAVVDRTIAAFGQIDILINNAGISWAAEPDTMPLDKWQKVINTNLTGTFLFSQAAGREMLKRQSGCIINIASIAGMTGSVSTSHWAAYAASKAGIIGLTRELAATWGRSHIRVNAIAPGYVPVATKKTVHKPEAAAALRERIAGEQCLPRTQVPDDLCGPIEFLSSADSDFVTGQVLNVDRGWAFN